MGVTIVAMTIVGNKTDAIDSEIQTKGHLGNSELIESNSENDTSVHNMNGFMDIYKVSIVYIYFDVLKFINIIQIGNNNTSLINFSFWHTL